jgi:hypothetical protein
MKSQQILEGVKRRSSNNAARAKQKQERAGDRTADGGVHAIEHTVHRSRKQEAAAAKHVAKPPRRRWQRASTLPAMPEIPGYHVEYVRRDNRNRGDHANLLAHIRSGWEVCTLRDFEDDNLPTVQIAKHGEVIGNDDTILMKIHEETWAEREHEYNSARDLATKAINAKTPKLDVQHKDFPFYKDDMKNVHTSKHQQVGIKKRGQVADDD